MLLQSSQSMRGYGQVDEDIDEYEDDVEDGYADDGADEYEDEEEDEEKEDEPISEDSLKYLDFRQKLKEKLRSKLRKENGSTLNNTQDMKRRPTLGNFGSFFGPSQPVIADRVIQESKSLLETRHLAPKLSNSQNDAINISMPCTSGSKNGVSSKPPTVQVKSKAQIIRATRDYSFLLSDDAEAPKPARDPGPRKNLAPKTDARSAHLPSKSNEASGHSGRKMSNDSEQRKASSGTTQARPARTEPPQKTIGNRATHVSSETKRPPEFRKQTQSKSNSSARLPVRPAVPKGLPPKKPSQPNVKKGPVSSMEKKAPAAHGGNKAPPVAKNSQPDRSSLVKSKISGVHNHLEQNRGVQRSSDSKMLKKENVPASKSQMVRPPKHDSVRANADKHHIEKQKPAGQLSSHKHSRPSDKDSYSKKRRAENALPDEECDFRSVIRSLFRQPKHYEDIDDDEDDCMEASFSTIQQEEKRSARIAKQEDDEALVEIMEEERQERLRKKAKMQKMRQR